MLMTIHHYMKSHYFFRGLTDWTLRIRTHLNAFARKLHRKL